MENKFGFQPNINNMEEYLKSNAPSEQNEGPNWWSIPKGMSSIRILPPWDATGRVALPVYSHPIEFQGKDMKYKKWSWTCVNKTFGKPCNICNGLAAIKEAGVDTSNYEPNRRTFYLNAIVIHDPGNTVQPGTHVLMKAPKTVYDWIVSSITNPMIGDITSITNGIDIIINKEGDGLGTTYTTTLSPNGRTAIPKEYLDNIKELYNLDDIFSYGFEQEQVDELVASLNKSSNAMMGGIPSMSQQMSGMYQQPQQFVPNQPMVAPTNVAPQVNQAPPAFGGGMVNQQPSFPMNAPVTTPQPQAPTTNVGSDTPECFAKSYSPSNVGCVTCAHEIPCSQQCGK